ncbi:hypothetical protein K435DRAFT_652024 [Dendrothele bispora CBS 962.96]|uniref:Uncharacterized protein n=1 Tax=Dendrothele bispora (strain CBS 962.96) TaxID=1314807 RepID=A0A4S8MKC7_DENBC|nr:hypothetical protein K435DRAFT_652024 [Dendrothele bispora CBS 962.96]
MDYSPYPNRLMMLLDIIDNMPRLRLLTNHFKIILWLLENAGVKNVPSKDVFRKMQKELRNMCGSEPMECTSSVGNHFYMNDPRESIKRQFANPQVAPHINLYPEETEGPISEVWQADRWHEFDPEDLTPMYLHNGKQFYINEVSMLQDNRLVIPLLWVKRHGEMYADCHIIDVLSDGTWNRNTETVQSIPADNFDSTCLEIIQAIPDGKLPWKDCESVPIMPNPKRKLVGEDEDLCVVMIPVWADDVSGNKSKQFNKHINLYMENSNLPSRLLQQEYFVNFVSTSPHATAPEQLSEVRRIVEETKTNPIKCYNAHTKRMCGVILQVPGLPADNPQQSEEASHIGSNGNKLCRRCHVGGSHEEKESNRVGVLRSAVEIKESLEKQLKVAMTGNQKRVKELQTLTGTKDTVTEHWIGILLKRADEILEANPGKDETELVEELTTWLDLQPGDKMNPLLDISGLDPTKDTPVEILHTILLGIVKYTWLLFHKTLVSPEQQELFVQRLQSTNDDGLTIPPISAAYMMQYRNALIGKHFKTLMQTMVFHIHDFTTPAEFEVIKAVGELGAQLWVPSIENMPQYLNDLEIRIGNVLDAFAAVDANKITCKIKLHLLTHLIEDCRRYGPAIHNSTETFECFNAVFRMCSILSNHQAPSRDITRKLASMDRLKQILSGGYWLYKDTWICASPRVRHILLQDQFIQRHLGWVPTCSPEYGMYLCSSGVYILLKSVCPLPRKDQNTIDWITTKALTACKAVIKTKSWCQNKSVIAQSGDVCLKGSWVAVKSGEKFAIGRLIEILSPSPNTQKDRDDPEYILTIEDFVLGKDRHPEFDMPVLWRPGQHDLDSPIFITASTEDILFRLSAQHDCRMTGCKPTRARVVRQERKATSRRVMDLTHADDDRFVINTHALHNASRLQNFLPRHLVEPKPLHQDQQAFHEGVAKSYRESQAKKRKATSENGRQH